MSVQMNKDGKLVQISGQLYHADIFPGQITMGANLLAPYGWLKCDGASYLKTDYPDLYAAIGDTYNQPGIEAGKFSVPDMRNQFAMGAGDKAVGTKVEAGLPNIEGTLGNVFSGTHEDPFAFNLSGCVKRSYNWYNVFVPQSGASENYVTGADLNAHYVFNKNGEAIKETLYGASDTVQPPAVVLNYFIKY